MDVRIGQGLTIASFQGDISGFGAPLPPVGPDHSPRINAVRYAVAGFDAAQRAPVMSG
jgi:hypothetical protein